MLKLLGIRRKFGERRNTCSSTEYDQNWKLDVESKHFLGIFPDLVWKHIGKHLDHNTFQNLINSSPFFRNIFQEKRVELLFKNVLQIIGPWLRGNVHYKHGRAYFDTDEHEVEAFILNCRLVCRAWNNGLCDIAQEIFLEGRKPCYKLDDARSVFGFLNKAYEFNDSENIENFLEKFDRCTSNPFMSEVVCITVPPFTSDLLDTFNDQIFHDKIVNLLEQFGIHVRYCEIRLSRMFTTDRYNREHPHLGYNLEQTYLKLLDILWTLPNLKVLKIKSNGNINEQPLETTRMPPTFEKLKRLDFYYVCPTINHAIISENRKISNLSICHESYEKQGAGYLSYAYENLEHVNLMWYNLSEINYLKDVNLAWKLRSLTLSHCDDENNCSTTWIDVFNVLSVQCGQTLENLTLGLPEVIKGEKRSKLEHDMSKYRHDLPKLKTIHLLVKNCSKLDDIWRVSCSLEHLHISVDKQRESTKQEELVKVKRKVSVKIFSCFCKYCRVKLWESNPKLKTVRLSDDNERFYRRSELKLWKNKSTLYKCICKLIHPTKTYDPLA